MNNRINDIYKDTRRIKALFENVSLNEEVDETEKAFDDIFKSVEDELKQTKDIAQAENSNGQTLNEEVGLLLVAGVMISIPKLVEYVAKIIEKFKPVLSKIFGQDKDGSQTAQKLKDWSHKEHDRQIKILQWIVKTVFRVKDEDKSSKLAEILFSLIVIGLFLASGIGAVQALKGMNLGTFGFETLLTAVKGKKITDNIPSLVGAFKQLLG